MLVTSDYLLAITKCEMKHREYCQLESLAFWHYKKL